MDQLRASFKLTPQKKILHPKGDIFHVMKRSDDGFEGFGEAYFTTILFDEIKGWKCHTLMHMNLIVPIGEVCFYLHNKDLNKTSKVNLGESDYSRLTIPPGIWVAFKGLGAHKNLILNLASIEHDPTEAMNVPLESFELEK